MNLDDYFEVLAPDDIRLKGHRIGIETVLYEYIHRARTPEQIVADFDTLTLEEIYGTILYYLRHRPAMDANLAAWLEHGHRMRQAQAEANANDSAYADFQARMQRVRAEREARDATVAMALVVT